MSPAVLAQSPLLDVLHPSPNQYIVVLQPGVASLSGVLSDRLPAVQDLASEIAGVYGGEAGLVFEHAIQGFVLRMDADRISNVVLDPRVAWVERDRLVSAAATQATPPSWGLDRSDQADLPLDSVYTSHLDAVGVDVYVVDSGIRSTHADFGGRVDTARAFTRVQDGAGTEDCNGHGTHVAGVIAGSSYGVAKQAILHPVRVLDCNGNGLLSNLIAGVDWITSLYPTAPHPPAVANISIVTEASDALDTAVRSSIQAGVVYVVAAGNASGDACLYSPARVVEAITVGATDGSDVKYSASNFSNCLDLFAPGVGIVSTFIRSDADAVLMTGTSAAAPHVAGTAALYLEHEPAATPAQVQAVILSAATRNRLTGIGHGSPNLLLYSAFAGSGQDYPPFASFTFTCSDRTCDFDASRSGDDHGIVSYTWNFGDGGTGSGIKVRHRYRSATGAYLVTLSVKDTLGQVSTVQREVRFSW